MMSISLFLFKNYYNRIYFLKENKKIILKTYKYFKKIKKTKSNLKIK